MPQTRRLWMLATGLVLLGLVFEGRWVVAAFFHHGKGRAAALLPTTGTVAGPRGLPLAVSERGGVAGPVLVLTHGWGADRDDWVDAVASLPTGLKVVAWDLPGLGQSPASADTDESLANFADALDRVIASQAGRPVILVGHSIGGMVNLEYVRRHPERLGNDVVGIVQVDTTYTNPVETKKHADRSRMLQKPLYEPLLHVISSTSPACRALGWLAYRSGLAHLQLAMGSFAGAETWEQLDRMASYAYRSSPAVIAQGTLAMLHWDATAVLPTVRVPTLILSGEQDTTTLPSASQRMKQDIPQSDLRTIRAAAHLGPVEQAGSYAQAIAEFAVLPVSAGVVAAR